MVVFVLCVLCTLSLILSFLTLAAVSRVFVEVRSSDAAIIQLSESVEDLNGQVQSAMDCLISTDAKISPEADAE